MIVGLLAGLLTGILTGAGVGGGTLLVLYLTAIAGMEQGMAQGVNLMYFLVCAPAALFSHIKNKLVEIKGGLWAAAAGTLVAFAAARLSIGTDQTLLSKAFGGLLLVVGLKELFQKKKPNQGGEED